MPANTAAPGVDACAIAEKQLGRIGDLAQALGHHLEHADLVGGAEAVLHRAQDAVGVPAVPFEIQHGVDHVLDHLGAGDLSVLGHVADEQQRAADVLGVADQRLRGGAHLAHRAGRRLDRFGPQRLDGIDDDEIGRRSGFERRQDVRQAGFAGERDRRIRQAEALGAQAHLRRRFLAGKIDGAPAGARQRRRELQQQRRFADARLAADEQRRSRDDAAAGDAVELADAGREARRLLRRYP